MDGEAGDRRSQFITLIRLNDSDGEIDISLLRKFLSRPFMDGEPVLRLYNWELSLGVLPLRRELWDSTVRTRVNQYNFLISSLFRDCTGGSVTECPQVMDGIRHDVMRLPQIIEEIGSIVGPSQQEMYVRRLERVIYAFSIANTRCPYTQGFHEIAGVLYCVTLRGVRELGLDDNTVEVIVFFMLSNAIIESGLYRVFSMLGQFDEMKSTFQVIVDVIRREDEDLAQHLFGDLRIQPLMFAFQWVSILFAQKLKFSDVVKLWDQILIFGPKLVDFAMMLSAACVLLKKDELRNLDSEGVMAELQDTKDADVNDMFQLATVLYDA